MYDLKKLGKRLKEKGLIEIEDSAEMIIEEVLTWIEEEVKASSQTWDDIALAVIPALKPFIMSQIDKIDGKKG